MSDPEQKPMRLLPVKFITEKDPSFRTFHADGAWGMTNHEGSVHLNFFVERDQLPDAVIHGITKEGLLSDMTEIVRVKDKDHFIVVRDFQFSVVMSIDSAEQVHTILGNFIKTAKEIIADDDEDEKQD